MDNNTMGPKMNAKPATPLPWERGPWIRSEGRAVYTNIANGPTRVASVSVHGRFRDSDRHLSRRRDDGSYVGTLSEEDCERDAAYLTHACNAYPKLVEALRLAADDLLDGDYEMRAGYSAELRALLRELGEAK